LIRPGFLDALLACAWADQSRVPPAATTWAAFSTRRSQGLERVGVLSIESLERRVTHRNAKARESSITGVTPGLIADQRPANGHQLALGGVGKTRPTPLSERDPGAARGQRRFATLRALP